MSKRAQGKAYFILWACVVLLTATTALARSAFAADAIKIGYVDMRVALNESDPGKKAKTELETLIKTKQASIEEKGKNVEKLKSELEKQGSVLSADAKKAKEEEIERQLRDYQRMVQDAQAEVKKREDQVTGSILKEIRDIIDKIGQEDGYSLIFENVEGIIVFSRKDLDVTDRVIKRYNEARAQEKK